MNKEIFKKLKNHKLILNKNIIKNGKITLKLNRINKKEDNSRTPPNAKINSKSANKSRTQTKSKIKIINGGINKFPTIKLPIFNNKKKININLTTNIENTTMNNIKLKKYLENENITNFRLKTNKSFTLKNFHSSQTSKKLLLNKTRDTSYNIIKRSENYINKPKNLNFVSNKKIGILRHFDRKKLKENKSIIIPKHHLKLFRDNKFENNVLNKGINKHKLNNSSKKKISALFENNKKIKNIHNIFNRNNLRTEINEENKSVNKSRENNIDIISDISLSEEELNFSEEDSLDNMEFSLEDEEL
jgi:hypothetical protein